MQSNAISEMIAEALADESGAGFTVRVWLRGGSEIEMNLSEHDKGWLKGERLTEAGYTGPVVVRKEDVSAAEIVW